MCHLHHYFIPLSRPTYRDFLHQANKMSLKKSCTLIYMIVKHCPCLLMAAAQRHRSSSLFSRVLWRYINYLTHPPTILNYHDNQVYRHTPLTPWFIGLLLLEESSYWFVWCILLAHWHWQKSTVCFFFKVHLCLLFLHTDKTVKRWINWPDLHSTCIIYLNVHVQVRLPLKHGGNKLRVLKRGCVEDSVCYVIS